MVSWNGAVKAVLESEGRLIDLERSVARATNTLDLLGHWDEVLPLLETVARKGPTLSPEGVEWLPPIMYPGNLFCAGANYMSHTKEMAHVGFASPAAAERNPDRPFFFLKTPRNTLIGDGQAIRLPAGAKTVDWECELAVVVGRGGHNIPAEKALDHVAGYAVFNDVSAREYVRRTDIGFSHDWLSSKCFDTFGPFGPRLVPARFVADWRSLRLRLSVNGQMKQEALAGDMYFTVEEQVAYLSRIVTLQPGDVIATGTPAGVGQGRGEFLKAGDVLVTEVEGVGRLTNRCEAGA
jgi:2-keto-4-pentenoate hydratase/2-oxohepta-3-ene-1,7-dioic acid hydratase in catechol pathway